MMRQQMAVLPTCVAPVHPLLLLLLLAAQHTAPLQQLLQLLQQFLLIP
jgi:hypothetical protein